MTYRLVLLISLLVPVALTACAEERGVNVAEPAPRARRLAAHGLDSPSAMAFDRRGNLYVAEEETGQVICISPDGDRTILARGLERPCALCVDRDNNVVVAESGGRLVRISPNGTVSELKPAPL